MAQVTACALFGGVWRRVASGAMDEIAPGILHWTTFHDGIGQTVHSHLHTPSGAIFDPRLPEGGVEALADAVLPQVILLSNRHHLRHAAEVADAYGVPIRVHESGLHEFAGDDVEVTGFAYGEEVATGVRALELGSLTPEDAVFRIEPTEGPAALLFADGLIHQDGELSFVPDFLMGDDPDAVKRGLLDGLERLLEEADPFDILLFAHGAPIEADGRAALQAFVERTKTKTS